MKTVGDRQARIEGYQQAVNDIADLLVKLSDERRRLTLMRSAYRIRLDREAANALLQASARVRMINR